jgi:hypothetical protein
MSILQDWLSGVAADRDNLQAIVYNRIMGKYFGYGGSAQGAFYIVSFNTLLDTALAKLVGTVEIYIGVIFQHFKTYGTSRRVFLHRFVGFFHSVGAANYPYRLVGVLGYTIVGGINSYPRVGITDGCCNCWSSPVDHRSCHPRT